MPIAIFFWAVFTIFMVVFVSWTGRVLFKQKKAWADYAKKHKLKYESGRLMGSPAMTGKLNGFKVALYTDVQQTGDIRSQRYITAIDVQFGEGMPTGGAIATKEKKPFLNTLIFDQSYKPDLPEWQDSYIVRARDKENLQAYLTEERLKALHNLLSMKYAVTMFIFDELECVLRIETSDPLSDVKHIEKVMQRILRAAEALKIKKEEKKHFKKLLKEEEKRRQKRKKQDEDDDLDDEEDDEEANSDSDSAADQGEKSET